MILFSLTLLAITAVNLTYVEEVRAQSSYCLALLEEAEAMEAQWVLETSLELKHNEAVLSAEYEFSPIVHIQMIANPIPTSRELCRRANTLLSKKAASLCYCRGGQSYRYEPFDTLDTCEIRVDESRGRAYSYMAAFIICG